jgi:hypothetical protein
MGATRHCSDPRRRVLTGHPAVAWTAADGGHADAQGRPTRTDHRQRHRRGRPALAASRLGVSSFASRRPELGPAGTSLPVRLAGPLLARAGRTLRARPVHGGGSRGRTKRQRRRERPAEISADGASLVSLPVSSCSGRLLVRHDLFRFDHRPRRAAVVCLARFPSSARTVWHPSGRPPP